MDKEPLAGKVAPVTGGSRGIGKAIAVGLADKGADIVIAARTVDPKGWIPGTIGDTEKEIKALGRKALAVQTDLSCHIPKGRPGAHARALQAAYGARHHPHPVGQQVRVRRIMDIRLHHRTWRSNRQQRSRSPCGSGPGTPARSARGRCRGPCLGWTRRRRMENSGHAEYMKKDSGSGLGWLVGGAAALPALSQMGNNL